MAKFKVGDVVRRFKGNNRGSEIGHVATIADIEVISDFDPDGPWLKFTDGTEGYATSFVHAPKFTVGDRVRLLIDDTCDDYKKGDVVTVVEVGDDGVSFYDDGAHKRYLGFDYVEPVAVAHQPQLTIRAGAYYRTRDGRKVGPMEEFLRGRGGLESDASGRRAAFLARNLEDDRTGGAYTENGEYLTGEPGYGLHLIAEWVDEPAVAESKFKVGDRVETSGDFSFDPAVGTVIEIDDDDDLFVVVVDGVSGGWSYYEHELRLVAPATSGKPVTAASGECTLGNAGDSDGWYEGTWSDNDWDAELREIEEEERSPATIADIVRRLEALEAKHPAEPEYNIGDKVTLTATVTGMNKRRVNIVIDGVPSPGRSLAVPSAALRAA